MKEWRTRILLRAGKSPFDILTPRASLERYPHGVFSQNIGNAIYSDAVHRILSVPSAHVVPNTYLGERQGISRSYVERVNAQFDHFVIPLANAFRDSFLGPLDRLTTTISGLRIPVTVTGIGVAGGPGSLKQPAEASSDVKVATKRFMNAVLDRSPKVGVRGENTRAYLRSLGYGDEHVEVIGCPSLFRYGADLQVHKRVDHLKRDHRLAINVSPYVHYMRECLRYHLEHYPKLTYIPQDVGTLELLLNGGDGDLLRDEPVDNFYAMAKHKACFFVDSKTWIDHLKEFEFSFGTRIHGNIASLMAGTPATVLVHDSRTQELVDYHQIPYRRIDELEGCVDAADLYERADFSAFNSGHKTRFEAFRDFLRNSGLPTIFDEGCANPRYDERLSTLQLPGPVRLEQAEDRLSLKPFARWRRRFHEKWYRLVAPVPHDPRGVIRELAASIGRKARRWRADDGNSAIVPPK